MKCCRVDAKKRPVGIRPMPSKEYQASLDAVKGIRPENFPGSTTEMIENCFDNGVPG